MKRGEPLNLLDVWRAHIAPRLTVDEATGCQWRARYKRKRATR